MTISPARAFALGVCSVIALAGSFTAGIVVGNTPVVTTTEYVRAADDPLAVACEVDCPAPPDTAPCADRDRFAVCELEFRAEVLLLQRGAVFADADVDYVADRPLLGQKRRPKLSIKVVSPLPWSSQEAIAELAEQLGVEPIDIDMVHEQSGTGTPVPAVPPRSAQR